jgi:pimeloyl-ACP methyl ester carboxylesterase
MSLAAPPPRPKPWLEGLGQRLFLAMAPRLPVVAAQQPPLELAPFETLAIARPDAKGALAACYFPATAKRRGGVLLCHPWLEWGQSYFWRRQRIPSLRAAGYDVMTFDIGGVGGSDPSPARYFDRELEIALLALRARVGLEPIHVWGVSNGGYWSHPLLTRIDGVSAAFFEDVSSHLIEWSRRKSSWAASAFWLYERLLRPCYIFIDLNRHAPHLRVNAVAYASGENDDGVRPDETRRLAALAGGECLIVPAAGHLESIKIAGDQVIGLALRTFARGELIE